MIQYFLDYDTCKRIIGYSKKDHNFSRMFYDAFLSKRVRLTILSKDPQKDIKDVELFDLFRTYTNYNAPRFVILNEFNISELHYYNADVGRCALFSYGDEVNNRFSDLTARGILFVNSDTQESIMEFMNSITKYESIITKKKDGIFLYPEKMNLPIRFVYYQQPYFFDKVKDVFKDMKISFDDLFKKNKGEFVDNSCDIYLVVSKIKERKKISLSNIESDDERKKEMCVFVDSQISIIDSELDKFKTYVSKKYCVSLTIKYFQVADCHNRFIISDYFVLYAGHQFDKAHHYDFYSYLHCNSIKYLNVFTELKDSMKENIVNLLQP